ncbi:hypothetical protein BaRGS_00001587 [Batillaria attramentaria]|uniref:AIMP2 thioredoxin-like domain-containing protein n=1 Tax=Batillaria attramentaria TaxID=370345 RepID=A0ABD0M800_9CAEN
MGNVLSRCAQEVSSVFRNCRSKKTVGETTDRKILNRPPELLPVQGSGSSQEESIAAVEKDSTRNGEHDETVPVNQVLGCEHSPRHENQPDWCRLAKTSSEPQLGASEPPLSKEYFRRTYILSEHAGLSSTYTNSSVHDTGTSGSTTCSVVADKVAVTQRDEAKSGNLGDDSQQMWKDANNDKVAQTGGEEQVPERIRKLEQRQVKVLQDLQKLQDHVQSLAQQRGVDLFAAGEPSPQTSPHTSPVARVTPQSQASPLQSGKLLDLVVSVDPDTVPLSLLILLSQLSDQYRVLTSAFVHSSATDAPERLRNFLRNGTQTGPRSNYQIALSIVWKKVPSGPHLMVSPTQQTCIEGEANIARFLSRLLQPSYDSGNIIQATQIDEVLDMVQQQLVRGNNKERAGVLRTLNAKLGKSQWLVGSAQSLADVVAWSAVQSLQLASDAPANVKKWLKACGACKEFQRAVEFLSS